MGGYGLPRKVFKVNSVTHIFARIGSCVCLLVFGECAGLLGSCGGGSRLKSNRASADFFFGTAATNPPRHEDLCPPPCHATSEAQAKPLVSTLLGSVTTSISGNYQPIISTVSFTRNTGTRMVFKAKRISTVNASFEGYRDFDTSNIMIRPSDVIPVDYTASNHGNQSLWQVLRINNGK